MYHCILLRWRSASNIVYVYVINFMLFQPSRRRNSRTEALNLPCKKKHKCIADRCEVLLIGDSSGDHPQVGHPN